MLTLVCLFLVAAREYNHLILHVFLHSMKNKAPPAKPLTQKPQTPLPKSNKTPSSLIPKKTKKKLSSLMLKKVPSLLNLLEPQLKKAKKVHTLMTEAWKAQVRTAAEHMDVLLCDAAVCQEMTRESVNDLVCQYENVERGMKALDLFMKDKQRLPPAVSWGLSEINKNTGSEKHHARNMATGCAALAYIAKKKNRDQSMFSIPSSPGWYDTDGNKYTTEPDGVDMIY